MQIFNCWLFALLLLGGVRAQGCHGSNDADTIMTLELKLTKLLEQGSVDEYARYLTVDYVLTTSQGEIIDRDQALTFWQQRGPGYRMTPSQMRVRIYGNTAILTARVVGPDGETGERITKTFVCIKGNGCWLPFTHHQ
jgi:hypothetical protein